MNIIMNYHKKILFAVVVICSMTHQTRAVFGVEILGLAAAGGALYTFVKDDQSFFGSIKSTIKSAFLLYVSSVLVKDGQGLQMLAGQVTSIALAGINAANSTQKDKNDDKTHKNKQS